jgi:hypothetical protein
VEHSESGAPMKSVFPRRRRGEENAAIRVEGPIFSSMERKVRPRPEERGYRPGWHGNRRRRRVASRCVASITVGAVTNLPRADVDETGLLASP